MPGKIHKPPRKTIEAELEYSEGMCDSYRSLNVKAALTFKELRKLVREIILDEL